MRRVAALLVAAGALLSFAVTGRTGWPLPVLALVALLLSTQTRAVTGRRVAFVLVALAGAGMGALAVGHDGVRWPWALAGCGVAVLAGGLLGAGGARRPGAARHAPAPGDSAAAGAPGLSQPTDSASLWKAMDAGDDPTDA